ncbi:MAG: hypothetical protein ACE5FM_05925 [Methyloligellaceae bacterium]
MSIHIYNLHFRAADFADLLTAIFRARRYEIETMGACSRETEALYNRIFLLEPDRVDDDTTQPVSNETQKETRG